MPWQCEVCTLVNADNNAAVCNLCGKPKGTPDPDAGLDEEDMKHMSLRAILKAGPEAFDTEIREVQRLNELKKVKGVFGVVLNSETPVVVCDCITYLRAQGMYTEGIFRIPGQQDTVDALKHRYVQEKDEDVLNAIPCEVHDVATLLKSYFRWLPEPLVPMDSYDTVLDTCRTPHETKKALEEAVFKALKDIQSPNRECLCLLVQFLREVAQFEKYNKMSPANLATVFAPSLLRAPEDRSPEQALMDMSPAIGVLVTLIRSDKKLYMPSKDQVKASTKHKPKGVVPPPPGMGKEDEKRGSRKKSILNAFGRRSSKEKEGVKAPPGLDNKEKKSRPPTLPSRKGSVSESKDKEKQKVVPPKPAKEYRKVSKLHAGKFDIDKKV